MSYNSVNMSSHQSLAIKREPFDSASVAIKLETLESPSKHSYPPMHHLGSSNSNYCSPNDMLKCKKKLNFAKMSYTAASPHTPHQPSVARRNERERNRVKMVNNGFATLRQHVPNGAKNKKMSKVETLRSAVEYIRQLQKLLGPGSSSSDHSFSDEQYSNYDVPTPSSVDENCYPSPVSGHHMEHSSSFESSVGQVEHHNYSNTVSSLYSSVGESMFSLQSPASSEMSTSKENSNTFRLPSPSERISPAPSVASDMTSSSSPYDNQPSMLETSAVSRTAIGGGHEDELFDFSSWF